LHLKISYLVRGQLRPSDGKLIGQMPCLFERAYLGLDPMPARANPVQITIPVAFNSHVAFMVPSGYSSPVFEGSQRPTTNLLSVFQVEVSPKTNQVIIDWKAERRAGNFPSSRYDEIRRSMDSALGALGQAIVLTRSGKS